MLVSGGHTSLLLVRDLLGDAVLLGETIDDAAGEAFDKVARVLGLPYPGGPQIDKLSATGDPKAIRFPRGLSLPKDMEKHRYDFSFSGLKTAVARYVEKAEAEGEILNPADVAASFDRYAKVGIQRSGSGRDSESCRCSSFVPRGSGGCVANQGPERLRGVWC